MYFYWLLYFISRFILKYIQYDFNLSTTKVMKKKANGDWWKEGSEILSDRVLSQYTVYRSRCRFIQSQILKIWHPWIVLVGSLKTLSVGEGVKHWSVVSMKDTQVDTCKLKRTACLISESWAILERCGLGFKC